MAPVTAPAECLRPASFTLRRATSDRAARARKNSRSEDTVIGPGETLRRDYDLLRHFKVLAQPGRYQVAWRCGTLESPRYDLFVVQPYDADTDKIAIMETSLGTLELVLMPEQAPRHVENFVQLARAGYYDGTFFHHLMPGLQIEGGLRAGDSGGAWLHQMQAEIDERISPGRGLVGAARRETSLTSATQFFILLAPMIQYRGFHTFFAYVRRGQDVLDAMNEVGIAGDIVGPASRPARPIEIRRIEIRPE